jgi:nitrite reductase/ring-hydroxylating ferredoxin subunit
MAVFAAGLMTVTLPLAAPATERKLDAIADTCTHKGGPLSEGSLEGNTVICPWHGANFDVCTGKNLTPPAAAEVTSYNVRVEGDDVEVEIS